MTQPSTNAGKTGVNTACGGADVGKTSALECGQSWWQVLDELKATKEQNATRAPTDEAILRAIKHRGGTMTYVVRNMFWSAGYRKETPWYLRCLKRLEREGLVERAPTSYAVMICWRATGRCLMTTPHVNAGAWLPVRVQLSRKKGWKMPPNTVSVARPGKFGNPFTKENAIESGYASEDTWQAFVVRCFHDWLTSKSGCDWWQGPQSDARLAVIRANLPDLRGKNLACWCRLDAPCHADVLLELANAPLPTPPGEPT